VARFSAGISVVQTSAIRVNKFGKGRSVELRVIRKGQVMLPGRHRERAGFSLVELLVVMAVISVLASLLLPAVRRASGLAKQAYCLNNLRQQGVCYLLYTSDFHDWFPLARTSHYGNSFAGAGGLGALTNDTLKSYGNGPYVYGVGPELTEWKCPEWQHSQSSHPPAHYVNHYGGGYGQYFLSLTPTPGALVVGDPALCGWASPTSSSAPFIVKNLFPLVGGSTPANYRSTGRTTALKRAGVMVGERYSVNTSDLHVPGYRHMFGGGYSGGGLLYSDGRVVWSMRLQSFSTIFDCVRPQ